MDIADWKGVPFLRWLRCADLFRERAIFTGSSPAKIPCLRSRASLVCVTLADHFLSFFCCFLCFGFGLAMAIRDMLHTIATELAHDCLPAIRNCPESRCSIKAPCKGCIYLHTYRYVLSGLLMSFSDKGRTRNFEP